MWKLLRAEFYRTFHRREFYLIVVVIGFILFLFYFNLRNVFTAREIFDWAENEPYRLRACQELLGHYWGMTLDDFSTQYDMGNKYLLYAFGEEIMREVGGVMLVPVFMAPFLVGSDFQKRTVNNAVYEGYSRRQIFTVKLLHYYIVSVGATLFWMIAVIIYNYGFLGLQVLPVGYVLRCLLIQAYLMTSLFGVSVMIIYVCKDVLWGTLVNFLWMAFSVWCLLQYDPSTIIQSHSMIKQALHPVYLALERNMLWSPEFVLSTSQWAVFLVGPMVWIVGTTLVSYALFRRAELK